MDYKLVIDWLYNRIPSYQNNGLKSYKEFNKKINLETIINICNSIGNPNDDIKWIHVAGTNGKGSVCNMLSSILFERGLKVGLYTSPHIFDFRERVRINGKMIRKDFVVNFVNDNKDMLLGYGASFFEVTVAMMFEYFHKEKVDIGVIETGLGGRLDSTNIVKPIMSIITNVSEDHQNILGNSIRSIAVEKAGIIKPYTPLVLGEKREDVIDIFLGKCEKENAPIHFAEDIKEYDLHSDGVEYYNINKRTVLKSIDVLNSLGYNIDDIHIEKGFSNIKKNTGFFGRWEKVSEYPSIIFDVAHNQAALDMVIKQLRKTLYNSLHIVFALSKDKDIFKVFEILPKEAIYYFCKPKYRCLDTDILVKEAKVHNLEYDTFDSSEEAFSKAKYNADKDDLILVMGSNFLVSELKL